MKKKNDINHLFCPSLLVSVAIAPPFKIVKYVLII